MSLPNQIARYMSLREPQAESLQVLHEIADGLDFRSVALEQVRAKASDKSRAAKPVAFDTAFPSFCFALATGVGKTRLMGASIYYLWKTKGYRNYFILAPGNQGREIRDSHPISRPCQGKAGLPCRLAIGCTVRFVSGRPRLTGGLQMV